MSNTPNPEPAATPAPNPTGTPSGTPTPTPTPDNSGKLLANILGLIRPEEKNVTPPAPKPEDKTTPKPDEKATPEPKPDDKGTPAPEPPARKPVTVRKPAPRITPESVAEAVKKVIPAAPAAPTPEPKPAAPAAPTIPEDLTPEEREEVELARFIEGKDEAKKGLADRTVKFFQEQKKFLEKRIAEVGDEYDPATDPAYRKFLEKNQPQLSPSERRRMTILKETEGIKKEAFEAARKELMPEIEQTKRKLREIEERPKVRSRVQSYLDEVGSDAAPEVYKFYVENGRDEAKTAAEFPLEFGIARDTVAGATRLAEEFLNVRHQLVEFSPETNPVHRFMHDFVDEQGKIFAERGGEALKRDGKTFIHPYQWKPELAANHWTFDNEDILAMLKIQARLEAKTRIDTERKRVEAAYEAQKRRSAAPNGTPPAVPPKSEPASPVITTPPVAGASSSDPKPTVNPISRILKIGT